MKTETRNGLEDSGIVSQLVDGIARSFTIGTDAEGRSHHYYRPADAVVVYHGRDLERVEFLNGRDVREWVAFVETRRGWESKGQLAAIGIAGVEEGR
jgi:hypothetical protein